MRYFNIIILSLLVSILTSCEDLIDIKLNDASPRYVIEANLNNLSNTQVIKVKQTVNFDSPISSKPILDAKVEVTDVDGIIHDFVHEGNGIYKSTNFKPVKNGMYSMKTTIDGKDYISTTERVPYVSVQSIKVMEENRFRENYYQIVFEFLDPKDQNNYYKYSYSVNGKPFKFGGVYSDKFNNGLYITHEITEYDKDNKFELGDVVKVIRECVNKDVYTFWSQLEGLNPGSAAPANPDSNISNGALGYFSVSSAELYEVTIENVEQKN